jgi:predicted GIY-YIG superfamily endonuclease
MTESKGKGAVMAAWLYILRLRSGALYCGATENLEQRLKPRPTRNLLQFRRTGRISNHLLMVSVLKIIAARLRTEAQ